MLDEKDMTAASAPIALRGEDGTLRAEYVERVAQAIQAGDAALLRELVGDLHQADVGDLIEALDPELRPRLVELMGHDFDFSALTEVDDSRPPAFRRLEQAVGGELARMLVGALRPRRPRPIPV